MPAKLQLLVGAVVTLYAIAIAPSASGQVWTKLNDGSPVDAGEQVNAGVLAFDAVRLPDDDVVYLFQSKQAGLVMGRFAHADKAWQLWTPHGWSNAAGLVPSAVNHPIFNAVDLVVVPHPEDDAGLFGLNTTTLRTGAATWNVHSFPANFEFTDGTWRTWNGPGAYAPLHTRSINRSWSRNHHADFAFGADSADQLVGVNVGIVGAPLGNFRDQLTASRYEHGDRDWRRWSNTAPDGWAANEACSSVLDRCTDVFILGGKRAQFRPSLR